MTPGNHSLLHGFGIAIAAILGLLVGSLLGAMYVETIDDELKWINAVGAGLGLLVAVLGAGFIVRRFVPVYCPRCNQRMRCRVIVDGDTSLGIYRCDNCGRSDCPSLARSVRVLDKMVSKTSNARRPTDDSEWLFGELSGTLGSISALLSSNRMVDFFRLGSCASWPLRQISIESTLVPDKFLDKLRAETVNYEEIFQVSTPLAGYAAFLQHSFSHSKRVVARIEGLSFMLFPIGIVPAKGKSPLANAGALYGTVKPSTAGSKIDTHYRFAAGLLLFVAAFGLVSVGMFAIAAIATISNPQQEGLLLLQGLAVASCVFTATFAVYFWIAGRSQSQLLKAFLVDIA